MNSILVFLLVTKSQALEFEKSLLTPAAVETKGNIQSPFLNGNKAFSNCNFVIFLATVFERRRSHMLPFNYWLNGN